MESLRKPFLVLAIALMAVVVLVEIGSAAVIGQGAAVPSQIRAQSASDPVMSKALQGVSDSDLRTTADQGRPPGLGVPYMAVLDVVVLFTVGLMGVALVVPARVEGRVQGCVTFIFCLLVILGAIGLIIAAIVLVTIMISLLLAVPFGTIAYMIAFGFFNRGGAAVALSLIMVLKIGFAVSLVAAHQDFLKNPGIILLVVTSLLGNVIISFLHGFVPGFLVSITDGVAGIIVALLGCIWALLLLLGSIGGILRAIQLKA